jgi:sugar O-acyltransferase (sialic acid O-acetyltransferase NeuD family)
MKILGIYGAGGLGREVFELAIAINNSKQRWSEIVFIDDGENIENPRGLSIYKFAEILKKIDVDNIEFCIAIGEPSIRKKLYKKLLKSSMKMATLIHPEVTIPESTAIGAGVVICKFVSITCDINIGENAYIHPMACIGHDATIGGHTVISSFVDVAGNCLVGNCSFLAINVILKQGVRIGSNSIIGMASVVYKDIPNDIIALGNPARPMKNNTEQRVFK